MIINILNLEDEILLDQKLLPLLNGKIIDYINQWKFSRMHTLQPTLQNSLIEILKSLKEYLPLLENYFGEKVEIEELEKNLVFNTTLSIGNLDDYFNDHKFPSNNLVIYRDKDNINLTFWR